MERSLYSPVKKKEVGTMRTLSVLSSEEEGSWDNEKD